MPSAAIESSTETPYKEPHERKNGPWKDWELAEGAHNLERAEKIKSNPRFMDAIKKHAEKRADEHRDMAHKIGQLAKSGHISSKAMKKIEK